MLDQRLDLNRNWEEIFTQVCHDYDLGLFEKHCWIQAGYEDVNGKIETNTGTFFVKIFAKSRNAADINRYVHTLQKVQHLPTPRLVSKKEGKSLWEKSDLSLLITEWINGQTLYETKQKLTSDQIKSLTQTITQIHSLQYKPPFVYDSWAITSMHREFPVLKEKLSSEDLSLIKPIVDDFLELDLDILPKAFIHSDLNTTNLIIDQNQELQFIDWGCSNYYPRIMELAVIVSSLLWHPETPEKFQSDTKLLITEYQKHIALTQEEKEALNICTLANWAMYILLPYKQSDSLFNDYFQNLGRTGLQNTRTTTW